MSSNQNNILFIVEEVDGYNNMDEYMDVLYAVQGAILDYAFGRSSAEETMQTINSYSAADLGITVELSEPVFTESEEANYQISTVTVGTINGEPFVYNWMKPN